MRSRLLRQLFVLVGAGFFLMLATTAGAAEADEEGPCGPDACESQEETTEGPCGADPCPTGDENAEGPCEPNPCEPHDETTEGPCGPDPCPTGDENAEGPCGPDPCPPAGDSAEGPCGAEPCEDGGAGSAEEAVADAAETEPAEDARADEQDSEAEDDAQAVARADGADARRLLATSDDVLQVAVDRGTSLQQTWSLALAALLAAILAITAGVRRRRRHPDAGAPAPQ